MSGTYPALPNDMMDVLASMQEELPFIEPMALELLQYEGSIEAAINDVARRNAGGDLKELVLWAAKNDNVYFVDELYGDETVPADSLKELIEEARFDFNVELLKEALNEGDLSEYLAFRSLAQSGVAVVSEEVAKDACLAAIDVQYIDSFGDFDRIAAKAVAAAVAREEKGAARQTYTYAEARRAFGAEYRPGDVVRKKTGGSVAVVLGFDEGLGQILVSKENGDNGLFRTEECVTVSEEVVPDHVRMLSKRIASADSTVPERGVANATPERDEKKARAQAASGPTKEIPKTNRSR